jgi:hypothetical protein
MRYFALIIEENELGNLFDHSRYRVSLPEDGRPVSGSGAYM